MYFHFCQNNSGGSFDVDERVAEHVIIEANSADHANEIAEGIGIYFNGVDDGQDCECCGDRWYSVWGKGYDEPLIYDQKPEQYRSLFGVDESPYCHVYHLDGLKQTYRTHKPKAVTYPTVMLSME